MPATARKNGPAAILRGRKPAEIVKLLPAAQRGKPAAEPKAPAPKSLTKGPRRTLLSVDDIGTVMRTPEGFDVKWAPAARKVLGKIGYLKNADPVFETFTAADALRAMADVAEKLTA